MKLILYAAIGALAPITLAASPAAYAQQEAAEENEATTIVCRRQAAPTGSRIGSRRICRSQAEWNALQRESRNSIERVQGAGTYSNSGRSTSTYGPGT